MPERGRPPAARPEVTHLSIERFPALPAVAGLAGPVSAAGQRGSLLPASLRLRQRCSPPLSWFPVHTRQRWKPLPHGATSPHQQPVFGPLVHRGQELC